MPVSCDQLRHFFANPLEGLHLVLVVAVPFTASLGLDLIYHLPDSADVVIFGSANVVELVNVARGDSYNLVLQSVYFFFQMDVVVVITICFHSHQIIAEYRLSALRLNQGHLIFVNFVVKIAQIGLQLHNMVLHILGRHPKVLYFSFCKHELLMQLLKLPPPSLAQIIHVLDLLIFVVDLRL